MRLLVVGAWRSHGMMVSLLAEWHKTCVMAKFHTWNLKIVAFSRIFI